jgi:hypothetical protein
MAFITVSGENKIAYQQGNELPLNITHFVLANIAGLGAEPADRIEAMPDVGDIVDTRPVTRKGYVNENRVVYSLTLDSTVGDYTFNWVGLKDVDGVLIAVTYLADPIVKTQTAGGIQGNNLVRNFLLQYSGLAATTGIDVPAETWQIDFTARLLQIDERERLSNFDIYGQGAFFDDGFKVTYAGGTNFTVAAGLGYVGGIRCKQYSSATVSAASYPKYVYVDASLQGDLTGVSEVIAFTVTASELTDYTDSNGFNHYVTKIAQIIATGNIIDLRGRARGKVTLTGDVTGEASFNADRHLSLVTIGVQANKLKTPRTISLTGDVTGSVSFDGSGNVSMTTTVDDDSHNHVIANVDGLQTALDAKAIIENAWVTYNGQTNIIGNVPGSTNGKIFNGLDNAHVVIGIKANDVNDGFHVVASDDGTDNYVKSLLRVTSNAFNYLGNSIWHAGNDGATSGLDADLLDGQHGSYYLAANANAVSASKLATARTLSLTGDVTGSVSFDGSGNVSMTTTVDDDSHNHVIANVDGLQTALNAKAPLASPALTGAPTAPTPGWEENSTRLPTTAWAKAGFSASLTNNGYIKFPTWLGGLIIQWGSATTSVSGTNVTLPIAFPNAPLAAMVIDNVNSQFVLSAGVVDGMAAISTLNNTTIRIHANEVSSYIVIGY